MSPTTEAYYTSSSLLWSTPSTFLAGTDCLIGLFDVTRNGEGPVTRLPTIPSKRHKMKGGGVGMRGIISALSVQPSSSQYPEEVGMLAAGTWTRWVGLYDAGGLGGTVATWSIAEAADIHAGIGGTGITQTLWSSCGKYLYVVERKSNGVLVFDVRVTGKLVGWLEGRQAETNQRLGVDVFEGEKGSKIWAGGTDGVVGIWEGVGLAEGGLQKSWEWKAHDGKSSRCPCRRVHTDRQPDPVSSTAVHMTGTVVATCSGQRSPVLDGNSFSESNYSDSSASPLATDPSGNNNGSSSRSSVPPSRILDNSIKVWSL